MKWKISGIGGFCDGEGEAFIYIDNKIRIRSLLAKELNAREDWLELSIVEHKGERVFLIED